MIITNNNSNNNKYDKYNKYNTYKKRVSARHVGRFAVRLHGSIIVAIFYPFSQFCEMNISLLSLQTQPNTASNLFQRGVEYGKYVNSAAHRVPDC